MIEATAVAKTKIGPSRIFIMDPVTEDAEVGCPKINPTKIDTILHPKVNTPNGTESPHDENITKTTKNTLPKNESPNSTSHHTSSDITVKISDLLTVSPIVATGNTPLCSGHPSWRTLLLDHEIDWPQSGEDGIIDRHSIAVYGMTSGTTGLPKAAMISHRAIVAQTALLEDLFRARPYQVQPPSPSRNIIEPRLTPIIAIPAHLSACLSCICITPGPVVATSTGSSDIFLAQVVTPGVFASN